MVDAAAALTPITSRPFDPLGGRTVYAAEPRQAALAEVLGYFRLQVGERSALEKDAAFLGLTTKELRHLVDEEWPHHIGQQPSVRRSGIVR